VARERLNTLTAQTLAPTFWNDPQAAQPVVKEKAALEARLAQYDTIARHLSDAQTLLELGEAEADAASIAEAETLLQNLLPQAQRLETQCLLGGELDDAACFMEIHAGAGGTESCDWAAMLARMYRRWAERSGFKVTLLDEAPGDQVGLKSITLKFEGSFAYGLAKTESGVHRLVRISPFDSNARRHTSFASVFVYPEVDETITIDLDMSQVRVDTYRSSGAGGQHVNKTDSAIRLTHLPTNTVVACQQDRSQHRNREIAIQLLKAKLYELELQKQQAEKNQREATKTDIGWGHQIRSYVLQPYQMVKDLRTGVETSNTTAVLDGDLDDFIRAALAARVG